LSIVLTEPTGMIYYPGANGRRHFLTPAYERTKRKVW